MQIDRRKFVQTVAGAAALVATGTRSAFAQTAEFQLKWANNIPISHPSTIRIKEAADKIKAETKGRVDIQVFPNNQLGGDTDMLSQIRSGAIDFFPLSGLILQTLVPVAAINGVAFAFKDYPTVWAAMDGDLGAFVRANIAKSGLYTFDRCLENGFRQITSSTRPINTPDDLKGFKIRVPPSPLWTSLFKALGASPASINFSEVYSALQTKVVEGQENALSLLEIAKLYEVQKYVSMTDHMWDGQWVLANGKSWAGIPKDLQDIITRNVTAAVLAQRDDMAKLSVGVEATLKQKGMVFNYPDKSAFRAVLTKAGFYDEWKGKFGAEGWAALEKYAGKLA
jgi:tripartite ATP-independent transporter DctP family solute receptor